MTTYGKINCKEISRKTLLRIIKQCFNSRKERNMFHVASYLTLTMATFSVELLYHLKLVYQGCHCSNVFCSFIVLFFCNLTTKCIRYQSHMRGVLSSQIGDDITVLMLRQNVSLIFESRRSLRISEFPWLPSLF